MTIRAEDKVAGQRGEGRDRSSVYAPKQRLVFPFIITFIIMMATWVLLSGKFDLFHLSLGVVCAALVSYFSCDLMLSHPVSSKLCGIWVRFALYIPWLIWQVVLANLHLMYLTFHPRLKEKINPQIIRFRSGLTSDMSRLTFANSITLTPGTITVSVSLYGDFTVHAIDNFSAEPLPGEMEARVAKVFGE